MSIIYRKLYRIGGLVFPAIYYFSNKKVTLITIGAVALLIGAIEILRFRFSSFNERIFKHIGIILKERERRGISGTTYFIIASLLTVLFFDRAIAVTALIFTVFGDAIAVIWGSSFGKIRIKDKSLEGSIACFILCFLIGMILVHTNLGINIRLVSFGAGAATVMEMLPTGIDDNLTVPIFTGLVMELTKFL